MYDAAAKAKANLLRLLPFESADITVPADDDRKRVLRHLEDFARAKRMTFIWRETPAGINITRQADLKPRQDYRFDLLTVGETKFYECDEEDVGRMRVAASNFAKGRSWVLSVAKVDGGANVTRKDPSARAEKTTSPDVDRWDKRAHRFDIANLDVGESIFVPLEQEFFVANIRAFCNYHGKKMGRKFSVTTVRHELPTQRGHNITRVE